MKTNRALLILAICVVVIVLVVTIKMWPLSTTVGRFKSPEDASNAQRNAIGMVEGYFKTITDAKTGQYAIVSPDKRNVVLKNKYGFVIWSVDIIKPLEKADLIIGGQGNHKIFSMRLATNEIIWNEAVTNELLVEAAHDSIGINIKTGKVKDYGGN